MKKLVPCKSCGAMIFFAETPQGRSMPLDAQPARRVVLGAKTKKAYVWDTYTPHWATCTNPNNHRKAKEGGEDHG